MTVYADTSETNPEQENKQKKVGNENVEQNNCAQNLINSETEDNCKNINGDDGDMNNNYTNFLLTRTYLYIMFQQTKLKRLFTFLSTAASHLEQHDGPPGAGLDYEGECDGRSLT